LKEVIEPSEIITPGGDAPKQLQSRPNPWLRLLGRFFDLALFFSALSLIPIPPSWQLWNRFVPLEYFAWIPIEAFLLYACGTTPGKWMVGTELRMRSSNRLPLRSAFRRSLNVWFRGLGMGIVVINVICMLNAYYRLRIFGLTSWDREDNFSITHRKVATWRIYLALAISAAGMLFWNHVWYKSWF
jgi:hypothetical protein